MASDSTASLEETLLAVEDLIGVLQELYYRLEHIDDLDAYGVRERLLESLEVVLLRYDAME